MAYEGNDQMLLKVAVFGITMSVMCTACLAVMFNANGDYSYDDVQAYRNELISFSGESMLNESPWVLQHVYTPWSSDLDAASHTTDDGWLFGTEVLDYPDLHKAANIHLSASQKSAVPITYSTDVANFSVVTGYEWWNTNSGNQWSQIIAPFAGIWTAISGDTGEHRADVAANNWNYTGYRYVFDPTLPFKDEVTASSVDGQLSLVWYSYNNQEGLSGGLEIYGGNIRLASYSATDIIAAYQTSSGYATTYDFDFQGVHLTLSIKFDQDAIQSGLPLMNCWTNGDWSMAISSISAGNFLDVENSAAFSLTAGNMIDTFRQIYTFSMPNIGNSWMNVILWLIVGLPMTIAMLCVTLRLVATIKPF